MNAIARKLRLMDSYGVTPFAICLIMLAVILAASAAFTVAVHHDRKVCEARGGHLEQTGSHTTVVSTGKSTYVTTVPDYTCLDAERS